MKSLVKYVLAGLFLANPLMGGNLPMQNSKARVRMRLEYFKKPQMEYLTVKATGRLDKKYEPIDGIGVSFYLGEPSEETLLGRTVTDAEGFGRFDLPDKYQTIAENLQELNFHAVLDSNDTYQDASEELDIRRVVMNLENIDQDSVKLVRANISERDSSGAAIPQERVILKFYIERPLGNLPIGDELIRTNEQGNVTVDFPTDIPGDSDGMVKLIVRIEDNDNYGNIEVTSDLPWGLPTELDHEEIRRSLWASGANAPITLLLLVNSLIFAVWGTIFYIIYKIYRISRA